MSRHWIGTRKKSTKASQYRVGRYGANDDAASRVNSSEEATRIPSAPSIATSGESVSVEKNSANAATPSMETATYPMASAVRQAISVEDRSVPDTDVPPIGATSKSSRPAR